MGNSFNNINIRKTADIGLNEVKNSVCGVLRECGFALAENSSESDGSCIILHGKDSVWYTVCSDLLSFESPDDFMKPANAFSAELNTDVMGIACFDSDLLYLNLINCNDKTNAWAGVGSFSEFGIKRRNNFSAWRNKVTDIDEFTRCIRKKRVFAEEVLDDVAPLLLLPALQSGISFADCDIADISAWLYFKKTEESKIAPLPSFSMYQASNLAFRPNERKYVSFLNDGGDSQGVHVYFLGDYVEKDEITFSDVRVGKISVELEKVQLSNGKWAFTAHCPDIKIPSISKRLKGKSLIKAQEENCITVCFAPHGNQRKVLDITVVLIPEKNWDGQCFYYAWRGYSSKLEYIRENNAHVRERNLPEFFLLNEDDYDL